ncbi:MAG: DUF4132 domain-containing protein [Lachnospiraceae bacterium]|nr:DUF4132 domain-containing protein [Lachnospiraceae bacterium]
MAAEKDSRETQELQRALSLLELTAKNQKLAEQYLDLSEPEDADLLEDMEHQNFQKLQRKTKDELKSFLGIYKEENAELAGRFVRLTAEIGRETSQVILAYRGLSKEFEYLGQFLSPTLQVAMYANASAWDFDKLRMTYLSPLVETGVKEPEVFQQARELCCNKDGVNTQMLLAALYLYCVKPLGKTKSRLCISMEEDQRATGNPERIREVTDYLENRLINNIDGLFEQNFEPEGKDLETLQNFVRNSDLDAPIPKEVWEILSGRRKYNYLMAFLSFLAFLAVEHSDRFVSMLRLTAAFDCMSVTNVPLDKCLAAGEDWFHRHIAALEKYLEIPDDMYIRWALSYKQTEILERMAVKAPDVICEVLKDVSANDKGYLRTCIKTGNPQLYIEMEKEFNESYHRAAAEQAVSRFDVSHDEALRYLLGEIEVSDILPCVAGWRDMHNLEYWHDRCRNIHDYKIFGEMQIYRRVLVLECLRLNHDYIDHYWIDTRQESSEKSGLRYDVRQVKPLLNLLDKEKVPPRYQIEYLGYAYDSTYGLKQAIQECIEVIASFHKDWHQEWKIASESRFQLARVLAIRVMGMQWQEYKSELLSCASESSKQGRALIQEIYTAHPDWEADILVMLQSRRGAEREMAVTVLGSWGANQYQEPLLMALEAEKTKKIRTMIQDMLGTATLGENGQNTAESTVEKRIQEILTGAWKRKLSWLPLDTFPIIHKKDGEEASEEYPAAILISYADMKELGINKEAMQVAAELDSSELAAYIKELYNFWLSEGAQAKRKWVLYAVSIHGGETIMTDLYAQIQNWPKNGRGAMAAEAVKALALNPSPTALVLVDQISRKFKYYQVKSAAEQALDYAAEQLGITRDEMEDRIVPSLGFDEQMERIFDYGKRQFKVVLTPALSLEVYDEKGKKLKNMPAPGKTDDPDKSKEANEAWKFLKKQLKTVVTNQKLRLEQALSTERIWSTVQWKELYVKNPVMRQFATGLIWGVYENGTLSITFRYMEDGTFNTVDEEEYTLPESGSIGLVHPIELSEEVLSSWKEQLSDYEIDQPIEQLERPVFRVTEEEKEEMELTRFAGVVVNSLSLSGKLQNMGWYKGEVGDGGGFDTYYRYDYDKNAELIFSGDYIACSDADVDIYEVHFAQTIASEVSIEGNVTGEALRLAPCKLGEVDPRYFSETVLQLTKATASSTERRPYPDCKRRRWY